MKKLLCLFLLVACVLALASCTSIPGLENLKIPGLNLGGSSCTTHIDNNGDLKCDKCEAAVECTSHKDKDKDLKCDKCGAAVECTHKDANNDGECDVEACDYVFCSHEYSEEYSYNKTNHYFLPTCDCNIEPKDSKPHEDKNNDGICDVCEWDYNHKHTYQPNYSHDATHHWYAPTCEHDVKSGYGAHVDKANDGICDVCAWDYDHVHTYETEWSHDDTKHWYAVDCDHTIPVKDEGDHTDINNDGVCDVCAWDYDHVHTYAEGNAWTTDGEYHWHAATCGHDVPGIDKAAHANETDSEGKEDGECDACGYNMCGENHTFNPDVWGYDETGHWHPSICGHSTADMERKGHDEGSVNDGICEECGYVMCNHPYEENVYDKDETHHWNKFTCDDTVIPEDRKTAHEDCDENNDGVCDVCEYQFCNHEFDETKWIYEEGGTTHWHTVKCTHTVADNKKNEAEHVDLEGNDGVCDVCGYQICKHPQSETVYDKDETHHWFAFTDCQHEIAAELKTLHTECDNDNDGICDDCGYQFCNHPQSETEYEKDDAYHWLKFTECDHVVPVERKALHEDGDNDGNCDVCGIYCTHTFDTENWSSDAENHWHAASCGHTVDPIDVEKHIDTADNNGICDVCQYIMCTHTWASGDDWSSDESGHWHRVTCGHSVDVIDFAAHVDEVGNDGICDICEYVMCNHTYDTKSWITDKNSHWHPITCGHNLPDSAKLPHDDADGDGYCATCLTQFCTHEYNTKVYEYDGTHHWNPTTCGHPVPESAKVAHTDENNDGFCEGCQKQFCVHTEETEWKYDGDEANHWHKFTECGHVDTSTVAPHVDTDNDNKCDICEMKVFVSGDLNIDTNNPIVTPPFVVTPKTEGEE